MSDFQIASRYAKSLLDLSIEKGLVEEVHSDMKAFHTVCDENHDFSLMLKNPIIQHSKKLKILDGVFGKVFHPMSMSIFTLITKKQRESYLASISKQFLFQYNVYKGIESATVTTTSPLSDSMRNEFSKAIAKITGKQVELTEKIDKNIIGGFILRIGDTQVDDSISGKLTELKLKFKQNPYVKAF